MSNVASTNFIEEGVLRPFEMIFVEGGSYLMGLPKDTKGAFGDEHPDHEVKVPSFYLAKFPVTQALWEDVTGENPSNFKGADRPVEQISWNGCQDFLKKLNKSTGKTYRLPTEAEWALAARGGNHSEGYLYAGSDKLKDVGWYKDNSDNETHPIGQKAPNELGIYDLSGNVWEWCEDDWHKGSSDAPQDATDWTDNGNKDIRRVRRGGSWRSDARRCRVSSRRHNSPGLRYDDIGLRLALSFSR